MKTLFLIGNQPDNLGDVILNNNLIEVYRKRGEVIVDDHYLDDAYTQQIDFSDGKVSLMSKCSLPNPRKLGGLLSMIFTLKRPYDAISRYPGHYEPGRSPKHLLHGLLTAVIYTLFRLRGYRIILVGITMSTKNLRGPRLLLERWQAAMHSLYSVRDLTVRDELKALGIGCVQHVPDVFLLATPPESPVSQNDLEARDYKRIIICLRPDVHESSDEAKVRETTKQRVRELLDALPSEEYEVVFSFQVARDHDYNAELYESCKDRPNTRFLPECQTVESARDLYVNATLVLSNRLHCLLYGVSHGVPVLAFTDWTGHKKIIGAWKDFELDDYHYDIFTPVQQGVKKIQDIAENQWEHRSRLYQKACKIRQMVCERIDTVFNA